MKFNEFQLSSELCRAIEECGYREATYIQSACIPVMLSGGDIIGQLQTGTGKTAAFAIPIVEMLQPTTMKRPQALILSPTRELAMQVAQEIRKFAKYKEGLRTVCIYGGQPIHQQILDLKKGADIVVGTPGRILDHLRRRTLRFEQCRILVLDEADEMLNMGFREEIEDVMEQLPPQRQTVLFSATMPQPILDIASQYQHSPVHLKAPSNPSSMPKIEQIVYVCPKEAKKEILMQLISMQNPRQAMIFCNTKKMVDELTADLVAKSYPAAAIHGDMKQEARSAVMDNFKSGKLSILVATDVAARGIDVASMDVVFNYDFPQETEYYVHRIGRTGRAGKEGLAVTLITSRQKYALRELEKKLKTRLIQKPLPSLQEVRQLRLNRLSDEIVSLLQQQVPEAISEVVDQLHKQGCSYRSIALALTFDKAGGEIFDEKAWNAEAKPALIVTEKGMSELLLNLGEQDRITASVLVSAIAEATGLQGKDIGRIQIRATESLVQIPRQFDQKICRMLKNTVIRGKSVVPLLIRSHEGSSRNAKNSRKSRLNNRRQRRR